jgi:Uma2 family endonuclease
MAEPARGRATYQDVLDAPEGYTAEIIDGELHLTPRPGGPHGHAASQAGAEVLMTFGRRRAGSGRPGGWVILYEPELHLGAPDPRSLVLVPDLAGWRRSRMDAPPDAPAIEVVPDWVCEVLSPGARNVRRDRHLKAEAYHRLGVSWMWLLDPAARLVEVYRHTDEGWMRVQAGGGDILARLPPFDDAELDLSEWWLPSDDEDAREGG